ncbi:aminotransferase class I/II-fold pyridoxal phosphate-dependent enzyme [Thermodesulfobacteriota bacterium]
MKIKDFLMEEWLIKNRGHVKYNLAESGVADYHLSELINMCDIDTNDLLNIKLEDSPTLGTHALRSAIACTYDNVDLNNVLVTTGTSEGLFILFNLLLEKWDEVIVQFPEFQSLYELPISLGCDVKFLRLKKEDGYTFSPADVEALITDKTKLIIINNPHNPTGSLVDDDTIREVIELAKARGIHIIFDEHYRFLPIAPDLRIKSACEIDDYAICTGSIVKCFGLMGLRMGWVITNEALLEKCRSFKDYTTHTLSPISDYLSLHALNNKEKILGANLKSIRANQKILCDFIKDNDGILSFIPPKAGVVSYIEYDLDMTSDELVKWLIESEDVFLLPGSSFEMEKHFRLGFGISTEHFKEALIRASDFFKRSR